MTTHNAGPVDPFTDPAHGDQISIHDSSTPSSADDSTLVLGRNVSLTLGTDSLVLLDATIPPQKPSLTTCCGLLPAHKLPLRLQTHMHMPTRSTPYYNILDATLNEYDLTIVHASGARGSKSLRATVIAYPVPKDLRPQASSFLRMLLDRAYPNHTPRQRRIKILINPFGGKGAAAKWYTRDIDPILRGAGCDLSVEHTRYKGHACEVAEHLDIDAFDVVACCSGDGLPHEVFNGLARKPNARTALARVAVVQLPCGTGNALSLNMFGTDSPSAAALALVKSVRMRLDLMAVTQAVDGAEERYLSFLSQSVGIVAESDLGTENLRWIGDARFTVGFLARLFGKTTYPCEVSLKVQYDRKSEIRQHYREFSARTQPVEEEEESERDDEEGHRGGDESLPATSTTVSSSMAELAQDGWGPLMPYPTIGNFYAGGMPFMARDANFFQAALPSDGCLDLIMIDGQIPRSRAIKMLVSVSKGQLFDFEEVRYRKCTGYRIVPQTRNGYVSVDGESVACRPFQVEVLSGLGCTLSRRGRFEADALE